MNCLYRWPKGKEHQPHKPVTRRRQEYLDCLFAGCSNKEIMERLHVSDATVKKMLRELGKEAGLRRHGGSLRLRIVRWALAYGYLTPPQPETQHDEAPHVASA